MELSQSIVFTQRSTVLYDSNDYIRSEISKRHNKLKLEKLKRLSCPQCKSTHDNYKCDGVAQTSLLILK